MPKHVYFRSELPKTNVGKILRRALRDELRGAKSPGGAAAGTPSPAGASGGATSAPLGGGPSSGAQGGGAKR